MTSLNKNEITKVIQTETIKLSEVIAMNLAVTKVLREHAAWNPETERYEISIEQMDNIVLNLLDQFNKEIAK